MLHNDASQAGATTGGSAAPDARNDVDALAAGSMGPETGNVVSGEGTLNASVGSDLVGNAPGLIVAIRGEGAEATLASAGVMQVTGRYGTLTINAEGDYSYARNPGAPDGVEDVFTYTLANAAGQRDTATLTISIGREPTGLDPSRLVATNEGLVVLPAGVELSDIRVVGRDLVITLPDGTTMTIPNGAVFVPQLVIGDVEVPAANLAALLIESEPQPAAGTPQSSGGNFAVEVPPLDPGIPLGDLLPPTELSFSQPTFDGVDQFIEDDEPPTVIIETPDNPAGATIATATVDEAGLPARGSEPPGSDSGANTEFTSGTIVYTTPDGFQTVTINGIAVTVGTVITTDFGRLTITSIQNGNAGTIGYTYELLDNTSGNDTSDLFTVSVVDEDGDTATATLTVNIIDDVPTARADTDSIETGEFGPVSGNVITDAAPGDSGDGDNGADTVGADNATVTSISGADGSDSTFANGVLQVTGQYGVLTIDAQGNYSYTRNAGAPGGVTDTFNYTLTDGDGDISSSTLTISIGMDDFTPSAGENATVLLDDDALEGGNDGGTDDDADSANATGTLAGSGGDGTLSFNLLTTGAPLGFTYADGPNGSVLVQQNGVTVLTITVDAATGQYSVTQDAPIDHPGGSDENNLSFTINYVVSDQDNDQANGAITINVDDDTPTVEVSAESDAEVLLTTQDADTIGDSSDSASSDADFSGVFSVGASAGADGGAAPSVTYALSVASSVSGLTSEGQAINLYNVGGTIVGSTAASAPADLSDQSVVFNVSVSATGVVTLTQYQQVDHPAEGPPSATDAPFDDQLAVLAGGKITLTATASVTDGDDDTATGSETVDLGGNIRFADHGPIARADSDSTTEGASTTGNVLTGAGTTSGSAGADSDGADGFAAPPNGAVIGIASVNQGTSDTTANGSGDFVLAGEYGTLTLNRDGSYTYTADPDSDASGPEVFTYTVRDADGDTSTATLTINISDVTLVADNDTVSVNEAALDTAITGNDVAAGTVTGSNPGSTAETATGTLTVAGATSFTLNGSSVGNYGTLVLNPNGTYAYTLTAPFDTSPDADNGTNAEAAKDVFTYTATDANGNSVEGTITVDIVDDVPTARADTDSVTEGASTIGNVLIGTGTTSGASGADTAGADGFVAGGGVIGVAAGTDTSAPVITGVGTTLTGTYGTLVLQANGSYTYTANPNSVTAAAVDHFVYTIQDGDGDRSTVTLDITVNPVNLPADNDVVTVNEAAMDTSVTGNDVAAGTATGSSPGSTAETATGALTVAGATSFALNGSGTGNYGTLVLNPNGTYAYTLTKPYDTSPDANNGTNTEAAKDVFTYTATDANGNTIQGTITVNIIDDVPTATNDTVGQTTENSPITFSVFGNDVFGADGVDTDNNPAVAVTFTQPAAGQGAITYNASTGQFTFTPATGQQGSTSFTYTNIDGDGDRSTATVTINLQTDSTPQVVNVTAAVDDDALTGGNAGSADPSDLDANAGEPGATPSEAVYSGQINVNFGGDTGTVSFANLHNTTGTVGTETVLYTWDADTNTVTATVNAGARSATALFTVSLNPSGSYTVTLLDNILHAAGGSENNATVVLNYRAADSDGDVNTSGSLTLTFDDDTPTLGTIDDGSANNNPAAPVTTGSLHFSVGADSPASVTNITFDSTGITSGGKGLVTNFSGGVLTAYQDANGNGTYEAAADTSAVFTVTVNPTGGSSGQYTFNLIQPLDGDVIQVPIGGSSSFGAGPTQSQILTQTGDDTNELAVVAGWLTNNSTFNFAAWSGGATPNPLTLSSVNGSTAGWGVDDNNFEDDNDGTADFLRFDLSTVQDFDGSGPYTAPSITMPNASSATFDLINYNASDDLYVLVRFSNGSTAFSQVSITGNHTLITYTAPAGLFIESVEMYADQTGPGKVSLVSVGTSSTTVDHDLDFTVVLSDADGDPVQGSFTVNVATANSPSTASTMMVSRQLDTGESSSSLIASETEEQQKSTAGTNTALLGAIAAAGLAAGPAPADGSHAELPASTTEYDLGLQGDSATSSYFADIDDQSRTALAGETREAVDESAVASSAPSADDRSVADLAGAEQANQEAPTVLQAPTDAPQQAPAIEASPGAQTVAMPSAEALAAALANDGEVRADDTQEVGRVLADALAGGENGPDVDALLEAVSSDAQGAAVAAGTTATQEAATVPAWDVPAWDMGGFAGFTGSQGTFSMESLMVHPDAPQTHAAS